MGDVSIYVIRMLVVSDKTAFVVEMSTKQENSCKKMLATQKIISNNLIGILQNLTLCCTGKINAR